jgi:hypothetical protein
MIIERTEGNPFFIEETVQVLLDGGRPGAQRHSASDQAAGGVEDSAESAGDFWPRIEMARR